MEDKNIHAGHRERMLSKVFNNIDGLEEHELLEILLFYALPRVNTNPLAHKLLKVFGSLENVFNANPETLCSVDGVGERTASYLSVLGKIYNITYAKKEVDDLVWSSLDKIENNLRAYFKDCSEEHLLVVFLNNKKRKITQLPYSSKSVDSVNVDLADLANKLSVHKPESILIAHNHPSGRVVPSASDDITTQKIMLLCEIHGVRLLDHIIVGKTELYSYWQNGQLDRLKKHTFNY